VYLLETEIRIIDGLDIESASQHSNLFFVQEVLSPQIDRTWASNFWMLISLSPPWRPPPVSGPEDHP